MCNKLICPTKSVASLAYGEFRILYGNIYLKIDGVTTVEDGRQWLESNSITMYAPETEVTNIGGCNMELTYTVDTKSYVDTKVAEISTAIVQRGI